MSSAKTRHAVRTMVVLLFLSVFSLGTTIFSKNLESVMKSALEPKLKKGVDDSYVSAVKTRNKTSEPNETQSLKNLLDEIRDYQNIPFTERPLPPNTPGAFLHVGKAGGSTLAQIHAFPVHRSYGAISFQNATTINPNGTPTNYFGTLTTYIHTPDFHVLQEAKQASKNQISNTPYYPDYSFYVASLRDPLSRLLSVFTVSHPKNRSRRRVPGGGGPRIRKAREKYFGQCFPTLEAFATHIGDDPFDFYYPFGPTEIPSALNCSDLARASMANKLAFLSDHLYWSTKSILEMIPGWQYNLNASTNNSSREERPRAFFAVRTENMNQDFFNLNKALGDPHPVLLDELVVKYARVQTANTTVTKEISDLGKSRLCKALLPEYKTYFLALSRAINLTPRNLQESLELSRRNCPTLDWLHSHDNFI